MTNAKREKCESELKLKGGREKIEKERRKPRKIEKDTQK